MINLGNLIAFLGLICAIVLPIAVALFNDIGRGLKLDRHVIIGQVFNLPLFISAACLMCIFIFIAIIHPLENTQFVWWLLIGYSAIYSVVIFLILFAAMRWLNSEDFSSTFRNSFKENQRLKYLTNKDLSQAVLIWREFWQDSKTYEYLGDQHIYPYIGAFFHYVTNIKPKDQKYAQALLQDFGIAVLQLSELDGHQVESKLFPDILKNFEHSYVAHDYQEEMWSNLVTTYLGVMHLRESSDFTHFILREEDSDPDDDRLNVPYGSSWRMIFIMHLTSGETIKDGLAIRKLAQLICKYYTHKSPESKQEHVAYLQGLQLIASGRTRQFYDNLITSIDTNNSATLAEFLITCADQPDEEFDDEDTADLDP